MNKKEFIKVLADRLNKSVEECEVINNILEENFIIGRKNKEKTINSLISKLEISEDEANGIYETFASIITSEIKNKIKHPFKDQD